MEASAELAALKSLAVDVDANLDGPVRFSSSKTLVEPSVADLADPTLAHLGPEACSEFLCAMIQIGGE